MLINKIFARKHRNFRSDKTFRLLRELHKDFEVAAIVI